MAINYASIYKFIPPIVLLVAGYFLSNGLLVELSISWILLLLVEKKDLRVLGIIPTQKRLIQLLTGFVIAACCCGFYYFVQTLLSGSSWFVNKSYTLPKFLSGTWWTMQSVLYEELIFRGALLYIAIKKLGSKWACILSAVCFGVYHWFSMGAFGNVVFMVYLFIGTGIMGYVLAVAYVKTNSLYLPIALHFGWNMVTNIIFSSGPNGPQLLTSTKGTHYTLFENIIVLLVQFFVLPVVMFFYMKRLKSSAKI
ncbi:CPBP family intramembrane glutamic endopeptidase [Mucilaginibacter sp. HD30]